MKPYVVACLALVSAPALAEPEVFEIDARHTFPAFEVEHLGISTQRGRFDRTRGRIVLDADAGKGSIEVSIDAGSVSTGNAQLDAVLRGDDFLDATKHPALTYRAETLVFENGVPRRAQGELTIAGKTRPVELQLTRFGCTRLPFLVRYTCGADALASIRRSDFGITAYSSFVADEVRLLIQVEAVRVDRPAPAEQGGSEVGLTGTVRGGYEWK